ncbi:DNA mismatch repair endonuclease MutL [Ferrimonas balearica]|uniref:DNA mismatch repair endonuclease MutL n=1 Tax=Ferrimonas balearica TaxID=44012 RepID=UPI001C571BFF|nr:DNA mismatch repair endonuclease MutL [Ferrimonas balearica]MBW3140519.1 DNA mismatch repair endonuclease MutL [Ferrimonas balearica]
MAIQVLPPQLANQIAAGEVVERPASVVKELVENSLDAGATRIEVEIDRGGSKRILIRDNGQGINKEELSLALARHATSKVASLADLESILSFGFRGEALASISSVSRLTLSSRTADGSEAWQAYAEGREMAVRVQPTAHPVGTTVEVVDLFFNTPARRRFLKADKTEFTHIEEQLRRIALAREGIHFILRHNGKVVRQYRPASNERQREQRLAAICGSAFTERAFGLTSATDDLALRGYLALDDERARVSDIQYFYVNGRVVRDRLVSHAVRQAMEEAGLLGQAGFVLYLSLDPHEVDVNVHPAKHEVRFHQARYVHDFILQALQQGLAQRQQPALTPQHQVQERPATPYREGEGPYPLIPAEGRDSARHDSDSRPSSSGAGGGYSGGGYAGGGRGGQAAYQPPPLRPSQAPTRSAVDNYAHLMQTPAPAEAPATDRWRWLSALDEQHGLVQKQQQLRLVRLPDLGRALMKRDLSERLAQGLVGQPLLLPVSVPADVNWVTILEAQDELLRRLGTQLVVQGERLVIRTVPAVLRRADLAKAIPELLQWLEAETPAYPALANWLAGQAKQFADGALLWRQWQGLESGDAESLLEQVSVVLPWQTILESEA